jgi:hypothetical protein
MKKGNWVSLGIGSPGGEGQITCPNGIAGTATTRVTMSTFSHVFIVGSPLTRFVGSADLLRAGLDMAEMYALHPSSCISFD